MADGGTMRARQLLPRVAVLFVLTGCGATVPTAAARMLIPAEQEQQLGLQVDEQIRAELPFVEDRAIVEYVQRVGERVAAPSRDERELDVTFEVIDDPDTINAFATVGGRIYVYSGLVRAVDNEAELASVLAHEVAHVTHRDVARILVGQVGLSALAQAALGDNPGMIQQLAAQIAGAGVLAAHTREQERDADHVAVRYMVEAGYDPRAMITMYEKLQALRATQPNVVERFFATHPQTEDRIEAIAAEIQRLPRVRGTLGRQEYAQVERRLEQYYAERRTAGREDDRVVLAPR